MDPDRSSIVPRSSAALSEVDSVAAVFVNRMSIAVLKKAACQSPVQAAKQFRIAGILLNEPDHVQILRWAKSVKVTPEELVASWQSGKIPVGLAARHSDSRGTSDAWLEAPFPCV
jgi:hypothetical protein